MSQNCPEHGEFDDSPGPNGSSWYRHGDECSAMCVECYDFHTNDVGCAFVNISPEFLP